MNDYILQQSAIIIAASNPKMTAKQVIKRAITILDEVDSFLDNEEKVLKEKEKGYEQALEKDKILKGLNKKEEELKEKEREIFKAFNYLDMVKNGEGVKEREKLSQDLNNCRNDRGIVSNEIRKREMIIKNKFFPNKQRKEPFFPFFEK